MDPASQPAGRPGATGGWVGGWQAHCAAACAVPAQGAAGRAGTEPTAVQSALPVAYIYPKVFIGDNLIYM